MRTYNHPIFIERTSNLLPRDRYLSEVCPRPSLVRYDLPLGLPEGNWEPVQRSAQRVHVSNGDHSASRLHNDFSELSCDDHFDRDLYIQDRRDVPNRSQCYEKLDYPEERTYSTSRSNNWKLSKPVVTRRVIHEPKDRLIPIPVEHVRVVPIRRYLDENINRGSNNPHQVYGREKDTVRKNSYDFIDLSDYEDSSSDNSDCEIYPFTLKNLNSNAADVKTRRGRSKQRSEPYSINLRGNSPSPETNSRFTSPPTTSRASSYRSHHLNPDQEILSTALSRRQRKEDDKLLTAPPYNKLYHNKQYELLETDSDTGSSSGLKLHRCRANTNLIRDEGESAFSINRAYQFSDEETDDVISKSVKWDKNEDISMKGVGGSRGSSDSDEGITPTPNYPAYNIIRDMIHPEGRQVDYIRGDGNCFFRALSKVIYNTESCHEEIRQAVVDLMEKYPKDFEQFIDGKSIHDHIIYMRKSGTWGTQAEIYGAATLLQRDLYILSPDPSGKQYRWLLFSPRFKQTDVNSFDLCYITLCHTNGNHYDRIAPLIGRCNCALLPPRLLGVKGEVDLTSESEEDLLIV